jgi:hypothetical protein
VTLAEDEADAKKTKKIKVCHCHGADPTICTQAKVKIKKGTEQGRKKAKKMRKHLRRNPCDYKGTCQVVNPRCGEVGITGALDTWNSNRLPNQLGVVCRLGPTLANLDNNARGSPATRLELHQEVQRLCGAADRENSRLFFVLIPTKLRSRSSPFLTPIRRRWCFTPKRSDSCVKAHRASS